jgi:hypothetical protein
MLRTLLAFLLCMPAFGAGTVTQSLARLGSSWSGTNYVLTISWTGDATNGSVPSTRLIRNGPDLANTDGYYIYRVETDPGTPAPSAAYDIVINNGAGLDIMAGGLENRSATDAEVVPAASIPINGTLTFALSNNVVAGARGTVAIYMTVSSAALAHATSHAAGQADAITPAAIGAQAVADKDQPGGYVGLDGSGNALIGATVLVACNGTNDTANLQAKLNSGGHIIITGGTCVIDDPLVVYSNTWLDAGTTTISYPTETGTILRNAAATNRAVTDAVMSAGSTTLTSATANFTSADVGRSVYVAGANVGGILLCTTIASVSSATTAVLADAALAEVSGVTATIYSRDSNITITGGTWVKGGTPGRGGGHNLLFRRVDNLRLADLNIDAVNGDYAISAADVNNLNAQRLRFIRTAADGIHVAGPATGIVIEDVSGTTADDTVAFTARDWPAYDDVHGHIRSVRVTGLRAGQTVGTAVKLVGGTTNTTLRDITLRDLDPVTGLAVNIASDAESGGVTDIDGVLIDGVKCAAEGGMYLNATAGGSITIRNVSQVLQGAEWNPTISVPGTAVWDTITVDGLSIAASTQTNGVGLILGVGSSVSKVELSHARMSWSGTATGYLATVNGTIGKFVARDTQATFTGTSSGSIFQLAGTLTDVIVSGLQATWATGTSGSTFAVDGGAITTLMGSDLQIDAQDTTTTKMLNVASGVTIGTYHFDRIYHSKGNAVLYYSAGATIGPGHVSNAYVKGMSRFANVYAAMDLTLTNFSIDSPLNRPWYVEGVALTVRGAGVNRVTEVSTFIQRAGSEVIHVMNADFPADVQMLARGVGDKAYNTTAASACGVGPVISDGANFKNLYSGTVCN